MSKAVKRERSVSEETTDSEVQVISAIQSTPQIHLGYSTLLAKTPSGTLFVTSFKTTLAQAAERSQVEVQFNVTPAEGIEEFRRMIALKVYMKDTDGILLSPTPIMDAIWHEVILDTKAYASMQESLGCTLHHRPEGASFQENDAREIRLATMEAMYAKYFGRMPLEERDQLSRSTSPEEEMLDKPLVKRAKYVEQSEPYTGEKTRLIVIDIFGQHRVYEIPTYSCIYTEIQKACNIGVALDRFRLMVQDKQLEIGRSANDYALRDQTYVRVIFKLSGC